MIIQPEKGTRDVTDLFYEAERKRIEMLNNELNIFATKEEAIASCERLNELSMETES